MFDDFDNLSLPSTLYFSVDALAHVDCKRHEFPPPSFIAVAMVPERFAGKWGVGFSTIPHKATGGMGVHGEEEGYEEMVRVPKGFEGLLSHFGV